MQPDRLLRCVWRIGIIGAAVALTGAPIRAAQKGPEITLFAKPNFEGASLQMIVPANDLAVVGFAKRIVSFTVQSGTWQLCDQANFKGHCVTAGPGKYGASFSNGFARSVVSVQPLPKSAPA